MNIKKALNTAVTVLFLSLLLQGCALLRPSQQTVFLPDSESRKIITDFNMMIERQAECGCCLDAEVSVTFSANGLLWNRTGTLDGYLQARSPSSFKFIAVNPLGQPLLLIATDGSTFTSAIVPENKGYTGEVRSKTFTKYAPQGFNPEYGYYWLTGRLHPGTYEVVSVRRDEGEGGYWFDVRYGTELFTRSILFDPERGVITRHMVADDKGKKQMDVGYGEFISDSAGECPLPGRITVSGLDHNGNVDLTLHSIISDVALDIADFRIRIPKTFEQVIVQ